MISAASNEFVRPMSTILHLTACLGGPQVIGTRVSVVVLFTALHPTSTSLADLTSFVFSIRRSSFHILSNDRP